MSILPTSGHRCTQSGPGDQSPVIRQVILVGPTSVPLLHCLWGYRYYTACGGTVTTLPVGVPLLHCLWGYRYYTACGGTVTTLPVGVPLLHCLLGVPLLHCLWGYRYYTACWGYRYYTACGGTVTTLPVGGGTVTTLPVGVQGKTSKYCPCCRGLYLLLYIPPCAVGTFFVCPGKMFTGKLK